LNKGDERTIQLPQPVAVHLLYWTVFHGADGTVEFREDLSGRDALVARALWKTPTGRP
jgi:murein L,D-transpeptidase YcbB/YkuD